MADKIPHNALVVVADGTGARFFRNAGHGDTVALAAEGGVTPQIFAMTALPVSAPQSPPLRRRMRPRSPNS